jgi:mannose-6-phosphate isomerase
MTSGLHPQKIEPHFLRKVWGSKRTEPWFDYPGRGLSTDEAGSDEGIGEVWFPANDLLIKFIFTSENLSVQVHPDDAYAREHENSRGKTEMWHILRAGPRSRIALGFKQPVSPEELIPAAQTGEIMEMLNWIDVKAGETYFVPSRTVHAIGAGLALCEIQQNSDVTYRLFDYGRPRELHLQKAKEVASLGCHPGLSVPRDLGEGVKLLSECPYFRTYSARIERQKTIAPELDIHYLVVLEGTGRVNGSPAVPGNVFDPAGSSQWFVEPETCAGSMKVLLIG